MIKRKVLSSIEEIKAYNDPYRLKIYLNFTKIGRPATCKEIADIMGEVPSKIHYHMKKMEKAGILVLVYTKNVNGITAKYYEPVAETLTVENTYLDENSRKIMTGEVSKAISKVYNKAKDDFILKYEKNENSEDSEKYKYTCMLTELYLTDEEAEKLLEFVNKAKKKPEGKDKKSYSFFMSFIKSE